MSVARGFPHRRRALGFGGPNSQYGQVADLHDVHRIAASLPQTEVTVSDVGQHSVAFRSKGLAWSWLERADPKGPRIAREDVLAVRVSGEEEKRALIASAPEKFFTEAHYNGFPAILIRLDAIDAEELGELLTDAWLLRAPKKLAREHLGESDR